MEQARKKNTALKDKLLLATQENTGLLKKIAALKEEQFKLNEKIRDATSHKEKRGSTVTSQRDAASEKGKLLALANRQEQEIELLKLEISRLKTKCVK